MAPRHVIVDGSNLATEGRSMPSLAQLDQAVREFIAENPSDEVTVVVDASFGHRIDPAEVAAFEEAEAAGEVVSPPAGAIGRGDAFLLRIAEKTGATVLSNDSFQEFHGEHTWLFEKGRLVGGKPVPGVGWIFMDRTPVRGAKSREVTKEAKRKKHETDGAPKAATGGGRNQGAAKAEGKADTKAESKAESKAEGKAESRGRAKVVDRAIARATEEVTDSKAGSKRRRRSTVPPSDPVNEPLAFITFIAAHPLGSEVLGSVLEYSSHGAFVEADGARCYLPLSAMGDPPPRRARDGVTKGARVAFVVQAFDPPRRGIELAVPEFAKIAGTPTAETVEAEIAAEATVPAVRPRRRAPKPAEPAAQAPRAEPVAEQPTTEAVPPKRGRTKKPATVADIPVPPVEPMVAAPTRRRRTKAEAAPAAPEAEAPKPVRSRKAAAATAPAPVVGEADAPKPTRARKTSAKPAAAVETPAAEAAAPVKKPARKAAARTAPAKKAAAAKEAPPAKKAAAKKVAATKLPATKLAAKKAAAVDPTANGTEPGAAAPARRRAPAKRSTSVAGSNKRDG